MTKSATRVAADKVTFTQTEVTSAVAAKSPIASPVFTGNVGINSASPSSGYMLHVGGSSGVHTKVKIEATTATGQAELDLTADPAGVSYLNLGDENSYNIGQLGYFHSDNSMRFRVNAAERMRIDSAGIVTKPNQPAFRVSNAGSGDYTTIGYMTFGTATLNTGTHYSTSTGKFTAPIAGRYYLAFRALTRSVSHTNMWVGINVNGTALTQTYHTHTNHSNISAESIVSLSANDYVQVYLGGGGLHSGGGHDHYTFFQGYLLG